MNAPIRESGGVRGVTFAGTGTVRLSATNTYSGMTIISNGVLQLAHGMALSSNTSVRIIAPAKFDLPSTSITQAVSYVSAGGVAYKVGLYTTNSPGVSAWLSGGGTIKVLVGPPPRGTLVSIY